MSSALDREFRRQVRFYLDDAAAKVARTWPLLSEEQVWLRPNAQTLAPATQLIHLAGNMRQWVGTHLSGLPPVRRRGGEFVVDPSRGKDDIYAAFAAQVEHLRARIAAPSDLLTPHTIQGHDTTELGVWMHQVEHLSYHTAQLVYATKAVLGRELGFYDDWALG